MKGEHCEFSHDWQDPPNNICTFYQKGICVYGSRCRYEHVRISQLQSSAPSSSVIARQHLLSSSDPTPATYETVVGGVGLGTGITTEHLNSSKRDHYPKKPGWNQKTGPQDSRDDEKNVKLKSLNAADQSICSFAAAGNCPRGEKCPHIHGDLCSSCGKHCLHPFRPQEREEHIKKCEKLQKHLEALKHSQEIDCSVCLERVLSKPTAAERKFGILSECDHPFCISCIRNWRSSSPSSGFDVNSALRACPICRKLSYFVIPSVIWYSTKEEKQEIIASYKTKLRSIDCKHFDFGSGTCPFGSSCFYKHAYRDGRLEEVVLRQLGYDDGTTIIVKNIRFLQFPSISFSESCLVRL
nr:zinc finger CCCH domain-containing protein 69-like isoform X2 [Ipomoea batatas]GMD38206.1 zinc finger CCCH domain-containing protein 69-like isoform X2 [Ipomoea batatas]